MSLGIKKFVDYTSLTANEINEYLMQQTVMVFASSAARATAFSTAAVTITEGMVSYLLDTNLTQYYDGSAWQSYAPTASPTFTGTVTASDINLTGALQANNGTTKYVNVGLWSQSSNYGVVEGNKGYIILGNTVGDAQMYVRTSTVGAVNIGALNSNTLSVGNGATTITGFLAVGGTGVTDVSSVSCSGWFRSTGSTGWYNQTYTGGIHMIDSTWVRVYNDKNFFSNGEIRTGNAYSCNATRLRGSYGSINIGSAGKTNDWQGFEFQVPETQTFMVQNDNYSGMYRANTTWNWLWSYNTLVIGSDERYKREIEPLGLGMKFIEHLEPVSFLRLTETTDDDPDATEEGYYYGFTAQNVRAALDACGETRDVKIHDIGGPNMGLVACTEDAVYDRQYIGVTEFMAPVVEAIKELNERIKTLEGV